MNDTPIPRGSAHPTGAQEALLRRLLDVVVLPASRLPPSDRQMAGDILLDMLLQGSERQRAHCAQRIAGVRDAPRRLLRFLVLCSFETARPVLEENDGLDDCDLMETVIATTPEHRLAIAMRRNLGVSVSQALVDHGELHVVQALLNNRHAAIGEVAMDKLVARSRDEPSLCNLLIERLELKPSHAMAMFWWSESATRRKVLMRHAADRAELIALCSDVFEMCAAEGWRDPVARKALQLIERRQRNRAAIDRSVYDSLEAAVSEAATAGLSGAIAQEIGYLAGIKPVTVAKILSDPGVEPLAVLCKATGLKRKSLELFWTALRRPLESEPGRPHPHYDLLIETYDILSVTKAQTTLRYWNWSLSSAFSPEALRQAREAGVPANEDTEFSTAQRTARLVFGK
jgi:uncharacterized protein (DUF2336 family)